MRTKLPGLLAVGLLAGSLPVQSAMVFSVDNATDLQGTFSLSGYSSATEYQAPSFALLPSTMNYLQAWREASGMGFGTMGRGYPDNPYFDFSSNSSLQTFGPYSGTYTNSAQFAQGGTPIYWRYSNWQDTGGASGTFSGAFCFSTSSTTCTASTAPVPLPAAAWLLLSGLGSLGFLRRRKV